MESNNLRRVRHGALFLAALLLVAVIGFRTFGDFGWIESMWFVVITVSTVGFTEKSALAPHLQLMTVALILLGLCGTAYTLAAFTQMIVEGEIERTLGRRRMNKELNRMNDHIIVCGFGRIGRNLASELNGFGKDVVIIENDASMQQEASELGFRTIVGDATEEAVLADVGVQRACTLVSALGSDAENVFITLTARNMNPKLQIISRAESESTKRKLMQAGANQVVMPNLIGARVISRMITRPTTADLIDLLSQSEFQDLEMDELVFTDSSSLIGSTVAETEAHRTHKLLIIAVKRPGGEFVFNPNANHIIESGETAIVMGHAEDIRRFGDEFLS